MTGVFWGPAMEVSSLGLPGQVPGRQPSLSLLAAPLGLDTSCREGQDSRQMEPRVPWTNQSCLQPTGIRFQKTPALPATSAGCLLGLLWLGDGYH